MSLPDSCYTSSREEVPWWAVDTGAVQNISSVTITNRGDCCGGCPNNLNIN